MKKRENFDRRPTNSRLRVPTKINGPGEDFIFYLKFHNIKQLHQNLIGKSPKI